MPAAADPRARLFDARSATLADGRQPGVRVRRLEDSVPVDSFVSVWAPPIAPVTVSDPPVLTPIVESVLSVIGPP